MMTDSHATRLIYRWHFRVPMWQAECSCGWQGPNRDARVTAEDDESIHILDVTPDSPHEHVPFDEVERDVMCCGSWLNVPRKGVSAPCPSCGTRFEFESVKPERIR